MDNEAASVLKAMQALLDHQHEPYLCERCWAYVPSGDVHECDPEERARAMLSVSSPTFVDKRRRAKGYGVR